MSDGTEPPKKTLLLTEQLASYGASFKFLEAMKTKAAAALRTPMQVLQDSRGSKIVSVTQFLQATLLLQRQNPRGMLLVASTPLSREQLLALDYALAKGKITADAFVAIYNGREALERHLVPGALESFDEYSLFRDEIAVGSERVPIADVTSVRYGTDGEADGSTKPQLASYCAIHFRERRALHLDDADRASHRLRTSLIDFAKAVAETSFEARVANFMRRLQTERRVQLSNDRDDGPVGSRPAAYLSADGFVETETHRVSLAKALEAGEFILGVLHTDVGRGEPLFQPDEVALSATKLALFKQHGDIVFTPTLADADVVHHVLRTIAARGKSSL